MRRTVAKRLLKVAEAVYVEALRKWRAGEGKKPVKGYTRKVYRHYKKVYTRGVR